MRPPAVAGLFYPENANELRHAVNGYIAEASPRAAVAARPKALIVPHAGYQYSGSVAGFAYRRLRDWSAEIRHVVMIGPSHRVAIRGLAVPSVDTFETPLGSVPIDAAGRSRLLELGLVGISDAAHAAEHSLEVQLPFLQVVLEDFDILPITIGFAPCEQVARAIDAVWGGSDTLVLVSSDLSHYHTWSEARQLDDADHARDRRATQRPARRAGLRRLRNQRAHAGRAPARPGRRTARPTQLGRHGR